MSKMADHFFSGSVEFVDGIADDQDKARLRMPRRLFEDDIFEIRHIGEKQRAVVTDGNQFFAGRQVEQLRIAQCAVGVAAKHGDTGPHRAIQVQHDRQCGADQNAVVEMRCKAQCGDEGDDGCDAIVPVRLPGVFDRLEIHQVHHRKHDDRGQRRLGQVIEQRREQQQGYQHDHAGHHRR